VGQDFLGIRQDIFEEYLSPIAFTEGFAMYPILSRPFVRGSIRLRTNRSQVGILQEKLFKKSAFNKNDCIDEN